MSTAAHDTVTDHPDRARYEMPVDGGVAFALYREEPGARVIFHTETPLPLRGRGIGARLVRGVLDDIAARGLKVVPRCPFVAAFIADHPEYRALVR